ncbi:MAG TPA: hypothetical protein VJ716_03920 [Gaiellaceae bacterium]|nr:hypothetical protein [Gaiellaceae bacterium]
MRAIAAQKLHVTGCGWFWAWALVGAGLAFSVVSFLGVFTILPAAVAAFVLARRRPVTGAFGLLTGAGAIPLFVAYLNRAGPGEICSRTATSVSCGQQLNPLPWLALGLALFTAGLVGHAWVSARS